MFIKAVAGGFKNDFPGDNKKKVSAKRSLVLVSKIITIYHFTKYIYICITLLILDGIFRRKQSKGLTNLYSSSELVKKIQCKELHQ